MTSSSASASVSVSPSSSSTTAPTISSYPRRGLECLVESIAKEKGWTYATACQGWIQILTTSSSACSASSTSAPSPCCHNNNVVHVVGYNFPLNTSVAASLAKDKACTYAILSSAGVPAVPHLLFLSPFTKYVDPRKGSVGKLVDTFRSYGEDVVLKRKDGTSGDETYRVRDLVALERAWHRFTTISRDFVLSPFYQIRAEYRMIVLDGCVRLAYRKERPKCVGDGTRTVAELLVARWRERGGAASKKKKKGGTSLGLSPGDLARVPRAGEVVLLDWQHNLCRGARAVKEIESKKIRKTLYDMALRTMQALGLRFASVDVVEIAVDDEKDEESDDESKRVPFRVLEVNDGVMMESFMRQHPKDLEMCRAIYRDALVSSFAECARRGRAEGVSA
eukprot:g4837.t1